jgi:hypothetical protein
MYHFRLLRSDGSPADPPTFRRARVTDRRPSAVLGRGRGAGLRCAAACKYVAPNLSRIPTPETLADELTCGECGRRPLLGGALVASVR